MLWSTYEDDCFGGWKTTGLASHRDLKTSHCLLFVCDVSETSTERCA